MTQKDQAAVVRRDREAAWRLAEMLGVPDITGPRNQEEIARHFARHRTRELGMGEANAAVNLAMLAVEELANTQMNLSLERWSELSGNIIAAWNTRTSQWQPIETAPKDGTEIVLYDVNVKMSAVGHWMEKPSWDRLAGSADNIAAWFPLSLATHWLPLPPPPGDQS